MAAGVEEHRAFSEALRFALNADQPLAVVDDKVEAGVLSERNRYGNPVSCSASITASIVRSPSAFG
jgi:hypothetical protein